jgi:small basic protein
MFMCIICLLHLQAMFNVQMDLSSYVSCFHVLDLLILIAVTITYGIYISYMLVLFGIRIFNLFKYIGSMSLISLKIQQHQVYDKYSHVYDRYCDKYFTNYIA